MGKLVIGGLEVWTEKRRKGEKIPLNPCMFCVFCLFLVYPRKYTPCSIREPDQPNRRKTLKWPNMVT